MGSLYFWGHQLTPQPGPRRRRASDSGDPGLERRSDRLERRLRLLVMAVLMVGLPITAWTAGSAAYSHYSQLRKAQLAERHPITARLVSDAPVGGDRPTGQTRPRAPVQWSDHLGVHITLASVEAWERKGSTATVWLDSRGNVVPAPVPPDRAATAGTGVGLATATGVAVIMASAWKGVRMSLDRRRFAQWDREWELVEPRWTGRHGR
jgi:hypothetical protein